MYQILKIMNSRWSIVLALIPGINVLYLTAFILLSKKQWLFFLWAVPLTLFASAVVLHYLPEKLFFWGYYLFFASLGFLCFLRRTDALTDHIQKKTLVVSIVVLICIFGVAILSSSEMNRAKDLVVEAVQAISCQDQEAWSEMLHPCCDSEIVSVQNFYLDTGETNSNALETISSNLKIVSLHKETKNGSSLLQIQARITESDRKLISLLYCSNQEGEGIVSFVIT
ncbi:MAG: hypothetical protein IJH48_07125 [Oscillospiraceae bacterium]|nr:hypothetical protein [Oscillospiraceae bacterium]